LIAERSSGVLGGRAGSGRSVRGAVLDAGSDTGDSGGGV